MLLDKALYLNVILDNEDYCVPRLWLLKDWIAAFELDTQIKPYTIYQI